MNVIDRIKEVMAEEGVQPRQIKRSLANICGVSYQAVNQWFSGEVSNIRNEHLVTIARYLDVTVDWLITGQGPKKALAPTGQFESPKEDDYALIPHYSAKGEMGSGFLNDHVEIKGNLAFKKDWLAKMRVNPSALCAIYAEGSSMEPYIFEGDVVLLDLSDKEPKNRCVYAFTRPNDGVSIKRLVQQFSGGWVIRSDNPDKSMYPDEPVSEDFISQAPVLGRVIWRGGNMS